MNLFFFVALAIPLICLALLSSLGFLGVLTLGLVLHLAGTAMAHMRKIAVLAAIAALIAAAVGIWSTATFDKPKVAGDVQATEALGAPVSPHEIMVKQGRTLPVEYWADPF